MTKNLTRYGTVTRDFDTESGSRARGMLTRVTVPAGTLCRLITEGGMAGNYFVEDLRWIPKDDGLLRHDATYYGIVVPAELVTPKL